jgi:hypothetical protein
MEEQIQKNLELAHANDEAYLNELITYRLKFQGYKYDRLNAKPIETHVEVFKKFSHVQLASIVVSSHSELVITTMEKPT